MSPANNDSLIMSFVSKQMHALLAPFVFSHSSAVIIDNDQDLTELQSNTHCPLYEPQQKCFFSTFYEVVCARL